MVKIRQCLIFSDLLKSVKKRALRKYYIRYIRHQGDGDVDHHQNREDQKMRSDLVVDGCDELSYECVYKEITLGPAADSFRFDALP